MQTVKDKSIGVVPIYKQENGGILFCIVKHARGGHWGFPKGHPDPGESEEETALRELNEETSIDNVILIPNASFSHEYVYENEGITYGKTVKYLLGVASEMMTTVPEEFKTEILEIKWLPYKELRDLITYDNAKVLLDEVNEFLKKNPIFSLQK